jgi:hypothetical protein
MKLQDLAAPQKTRQVAKVMESYFGNTIAFDKLTPKQARAMLSKVRGLIAEQRRQPGFHSSENNSSYLKLIMMEQGLTAATTATTQTPQQSAAMKAAEMQQQQKQRNDRKKAIDQQIVALNQEKAELSKPMPTMETKIARRLREASEVQQAQVVLASKDMVDQVQKMIEQTTAIQFKDLPALVDQIRNEVGYDQATQFNNDATAALSGLVQNLQASKGQLEQALGVVTGQAPAVPGGEAGMVTGAELDAGTDLGAELGAEPVAELPPEEEEEEVTTLQTTLGRGRR